MPDTYQPTDEQIEAATRATYPYDEEGWQAIGIHRRRDYVESVELLFATPAFQSIIRAAQAEARTAGFAAAMHLGAELGWDAAVLSLKYEDGSPVEVVAMSNPYRKSADV